MKCTTDNCANDAAGLVYWPGREACAHCRDCAARAVRVAGAMGFNLVVTPLFEPKRGAFDDAKPCPFCGSSAVRVGLDMKSLGTYCAQCEICQTRGPIAESEAEAKEEWNDREVPS